MEAKVLNPVTGRFIKRGNKTYKQLLANGWHYDAETNSLSRKDNEVVESGLGKVGWFVPGQGIRHLVLQDVLSKTSLSSCYCASDGSQVFALKRYAAEFPKRYIVRESQLLSLLKGKGFPKYHGRFTTNEENTTIHWLVMEFCPGTTLKEFAKRKILTTDQIHDIMYKITVAVARLHELGYVHRDLSYNNILVDDDFRVTVLDLALAEKVGTGIVHNRRCGTANFMAQEVIERCFTDDPSLDVYSLGRLLEYLLPTDPAIDRAITTRDRRCTLLEFQQMIR